MGHLYDTIERGVVPRLTYPPLPLTTKIPACYEFCKSLECEQNDRRLQRCCEGYERTHALIHSEAEQKRKAGDRWDRVEGRIESLIQGRVRSRGWDFGR